MLLKRRNLLRKSTITYVYIKVITCFERSQGHCLILQDHKPKSPGAFSRGDLTTNPVISVPLFSPTFYLLLFLIPAVDN